MMKRIAIYARKSVESDKGDSIKNQITLCRQYIESTTDSKEEIRFVEYKDEGYTGANTFRPDFQRLMRAIEQNKIDVLVCYRLDRITRSVADFTDAEINKKLEKYSVNFVSVNERFDTTTPTGRAMFGIVILFAQLERETISERITDNMFIRCAECGSPMVVLYTKANLAGEKRYYYACSLRQKSKNTRCTNNNVRADYADKAVINEIKTKGIDKNFILSTMKEEVKQDKQTIALNPIGLIKDEIKKKKLRYNDYFKEYSTAKMTIWRQNMKIKSGYVSKI